MVIALLISRLEEAKIGKVVKWLDWFGIVAYPLLVVIFNIAFYATYPTYVPGDEFLKSFQSL